MNTNADNPPRQSTATIRLVEFDKNLQFSGRKPTGVTSTKVGQARWAWSLAEFEAKEIPPDCLPGERAADLHAT